MKPIVFLAFALAGCGGTASHLPNPLLLPGQAVITGLENSAYTTRRGKVSRYVAANSDAILQDAKAGGGPALTKAMQIARVPADRHRELRHVLKADAELYATNQEALVVAIMVHGR
ncbi:hypothetical protein [Nereida sp. MMG025]|uniref:hypothetical protein n=1 Tax=Nereida sp. MMG025 TaxID=2909981 RepID=UPI001F292A92|nr:hypothetical protein [Nereida sp. MMG025]MCF6443413.1 hypothetical protein [Nereida sp. MMG025]